VFVGVCKVYSDILKEIEPLLLERCSVPEALRERARRKCQNGALQESIRQEEEEEEENIRFEHSNVLLFLHSIHRQAKYFNL